MLGWWRVRFVMWVRSKTEDVVMAIVWALPHAFIYWAGMRLLSNATTGPFGNRCPTGLPFFDVLEDWRQRRGGDRKWRKHGTT